MTTKLELLREHFATEDSCKEYIANLKWTSGYSCVKCGYDKYYKGIRTFDRKCQKCSHNESPTAGTLFHKLKFSLVKAFEIIYWLSQSKKGMSSVELSRHFGLEQKTCWRFKRKIQLAMVEKSSALLTGLVEVDEFVVGGLEKQAQGRSLGKKKIAVVGIETMTTAKGKKGIKRAYAQMIKGYRAEDLKPFLEERVDKGSKIKTDKWTGYNPLKKDYKIKMVYSKGGKNFKELHYFIMNMKNWIRGIHHQVSSWHFQAYLDEFCFRFNNRIGKKNVYEIVLENMIEHKPVYSKELVYGI